MKNTLSATLIIISIIVKGTCDGTITDPTGKYYLIYTENFNLIASYMCFINLDIPLN